MLLTKTVHPPAGANPILMVYSHSSFSALLQPVLVGVLIMALAGILVAGVSVTPQRPPQFAMEITTIKLTDNVYVLEGAGGNVAVFVWDEGVLLVGDRLAPASPRGEGRRRRHQPQAHPFCGEQPLAS